MKMYKLIGVMVVLALAGCENRATEVHYVLPNELKDCKIYYLESTRNHDLTVMRCPNSTTSTNYSVQNGKARTPVTNIVEDSP